MRSPERLCPEQSALGANRALGAGSSHPLANFSSFDLDMPSSSPSFASLKKRRVRFRLVIVVATLIACELASFMVVWIQTGQPVLWTEFQRKRSQIIGRFSGNNQFVIAKRDEGRTLGEGAGLRREVIHPYVGYALDPTVMPGINEFGFHKAKSDLPQARADDKLIVGIVGGSVAETFAEQGMPVVERELAKHKEFRGKKVIAMNLASGGYKQPQQLMALTYMLTLGAKFDIVINLDGFNDVALHDAENARTHTYPAYPRMWFDFVRRFTDAETRRLTGHKEFLKAEMVSLARSSSRAPFCYSLTWGAFWNLRQQRLMKQYMDLEIAARDYVEHISTELPYYVTGPKLAIGKNEEYLFLADVWSHCSLQLHRLCKANDIRYFHFLQPNQYVAGSKPMRRAEKALAVNTSYVYKPGVEKGYPLLVNEGKSLVQQGVRFTDLTNIFVDIERPIYIDECCHFGEAGNEIIGIAVACAIRDDYRSAQLNP